MSALPTFISEGPFALIYAFFLFGAFSRSSCTYGVGRYAHHLLLKPDPPTEGFRGKICGWAQDPKTLQTMAMLRRRGWIAIPAAFLTVGVQTFVVVSAGLIGLSYPRFVLAAFPGWLAWAAIYSTIGFAMWKAAVAAAAASPAGIAAISMLTLGLGVYVVIKKRKKKAAVVPVGK